MEMHQIRYFLALGETLNFTRAAEQCNVTQPSLTRAIQALEAELGGELIRRERSLSHLTELGERMLPVLRQCYETAIAAKSLARSITKGEMSILSVAVSRTVNLALIAPVLRELSEAFDGLQLRIQRGSGSQIAQLLKSGDIELAIAGPLNGSWERLDAVPLFCEPFELIVHRAHRFSGRNTASFGNLAEERFLIDSDCELAEELAGRLRAAGIECGLAHQVTIESDLIALLEANLGIAILPATTMRSEQLCRVPLDGLDLNRTVAVYGVAGRRRSPVCNTLLNQLRAADWPVFGPTAEIRGAA